MIRNFEDITATLTDYEKEMLVPALANYLKTRIGPKYAVRNKELCRIFTEKGYDKLTEARVRKCINYIRMNGLVPHLIANSHGYYCATNLQQVEDYIVSLNQRAFAIWAVKAALQKDISGRLFI